MTDVLAQQRNARLQQPPRLGKVRMGMRTDTGEIVVPRTWIVTSPARGLVTQAAERWGGDVAEWGTQWRVETDTDELEVFVWPGDPDGLTTWRLWGRSGLVRECNGASQTDGTDCACNPDPDDRRGRGQCSLETTVQFMIPDLGGWGVWWLVTGSRIAAQEVGFQYNLLLSHAQRTGELIPVKLGKRFVEHGSKHYPVPELRIERPLRDVLPPIEGGSLMLPTGDTPPATALPVPKVTEEHRGEDEGSRGSEPGPPPGTGLGGPEALSLSASGPDGGEQEPPGPPASAPSRQEIDAVAEFIATENPPAGTNDDIEARTRKLYDLMADADLWKTGALHAGLAKYIGEHDDLEPKKAGEVHYGDLARKRHMQAFAVRSFEAAEKRIGG